MGQVNRALDTKLDRDVALKVLPQAFTEDLDVAVVDVGERILWHGKFLDEAWICAAARCGVHVGSALT